MVPDEYRIKAVWLVESILAGLKSDVSKPKLLDRIYLRDLTPLILSFSVFITIIVFMKLERRLTSNNLSRVVSEQKIIAGLEILNMLESSSEKVKLFLMYPIEDLIDLPGVY